MGEEDITLSGLFIGKLVANTFVTLTPTISAILGYNGALHCFSQFRYPQHHRRFMLYVVVIINSSLRDI